MGARASTRLELDVVREIPEAYDLVLHAAAWTNVDQAESDPVGAEEANVLGTRNVVAGGAPVVYFSTDYVFDGTKGAPYVESDEPAPLSVYGRTKLAGEQEIRDGWIVRSSWLFGWTSHNFVRTMLRLGAERDEVRVVDDQRGSPTYVGHLAAATRELLDLPHGTYHVAARRRLHLGRLRGGDLRGEPRSTAASRGSRRRSSARRPPRPAYSVLRSERGAPELPHWRDGLQCLPRTDVLASARDGLRELRARVRRRVRLLPALRHAGRRPGGRRASSARSSPSSSATSPARPSSARRSTRRRFARSRPLLRADEGDRRAARRHGREVHRRRGDGGVRRAGRARGRRPARAAGGGRDAGRVPGARHPGTDRRHHRRGGHRHRGAPGDRRRGQRRGAARAGGAAGRDPDRSRDAGSREGRRRGRARSSRSTVKGKAEPVAAYRLLVDDRRRGDRPPPGRAAGRP